MVILILIEILNEILYKNKLLALRHTIKVLPEIENLLFSDSPSLNNNYIFKSFLAMLVFGCTMGQ